MPIGPITPGTKGSGEPDAGNPHVRFEVAGAGDGPILRGHEYRETGSVAGEALGTAPVLDPTVDFQDFP